LQLCIKANIVLSSLSTMMHRLGLSFSCVELLYFSVFFVALSFTLLSSN